MQKNKWKLKPCGRITGIVILMSFLKFSVSAEPLTGQPPNLSESGTRLYSDSEVETLINEISEAALEAIDKAAGEAAKAAVLSVIEREASALYEAERLRFEMEATKKTGVKNAVITGVVCFLSGFITGIIIGGSK